MVLACQNISKAFGTDKILENISFHINEYEKCAIVGINGAGKSTLLKIIAGEMSADSGQVAISKDKTLGYLSQQQNLDPANTIYDEVLSVKAGVIAMETNLRRIEARMKDASGDELESLYKQYDLLNHEFEARNGYAVKSEVTGVLKGLGFSENDFTLPVATLSGGQKTRVSLSKLLLSKPDIIMLDEPTNHLDMSSIAWLEGYLSSYKGSVIIVAHDRYFLDKIVDKVVELENTHAETFSGNYTDYSEKKHRERADKLKAYLNQQREIKHQEQVIETLRSYNREKSIKRAESRQKMLDKIERIDKPVELNDRMNIILEPNILSGNDVLTVRDLSKSFGDLKLFDNISFEIKRGDRVAIIGDNGTGKTTILKILNNLLPADSGDFKLGAKVYPGYYDQEHHVLTDSNTIFDEIQNTYPDADNTKVRNLLAAFLFTGDDCFKLIKSLSGGEKARVSLAKLMMSDANFLILDEPTNHLDITSKEILEEAVSSYTGTVLYVSHDRYFINKTATRVFELTGKQLYQYNGNYDYYLDKRDAVMNAAYQATAKSANNVSGAGMQANNASGTGMPQGSSNSVSFSGQAQEDAGSASLSQNNRPSAPAGGAADWEKQKQLAAIKRKLTNEFNRCEEEIKALEERNDEIDRQFAIPENATNSFLLNELTKERSENEQKLESLLEKWEELYEKLNDDSSSLL